MRGRCTPHYFDTLIMRVCFIILFFIPVVALGQNHRKAKRKARYDSLYKETLKMMDKFNLDNNGYHGYFKTDTVFYSNKKIKAIGSYAIDRNGKASNYKVGKWIEYYENGQVKSIGDYQMNFVWTCSSVKPALQYYYYKIGKWTYYYDNGQLMAQGIYNIERAKVTTGVADQYSNKPIVTNQWILYNNNGQPAENRKRIINQLDSL